MPRSTYQRLLGFIGKFAVLLILGFLILPAAVVTVAAFNDKAILSFPPQAWSWRWFAKAVAYQDFRDGFRNGLIVTAWSSTVALVIGAMFAFALHRYQFRFRKILEAVLLSPLVIPHFTVGLGFLILAAQIGWNARRHGMRPGSSPAECFIPGAFDVVRSGIGPARGHAALLVVQFEREVENRQHQAEQKSDEYVQRQIGRRGPFGHDAGIDNM